MGLPYCQLIVIAWLTFYSQDLAICLTLFLQGIVYVQVAHYTNVNKHDSMQMKFFMVGLALMMTLRAYNPCEYLLSPKFALTFVIER